MLLRLLDAAFPAVPHDAAVGIEVCPGDELIAERLQLANERGGLGGRGGAANLAGHGDHIVGPLSWRRR